MQIMTLYKHLFQNNKVLNDNSMDKIQINNILNAIYYRIENN